MTPKVTRQLLESVINRKDKHVSQSANAPGIQEWVQVRSGKGEEDRAQDMFCNSDSMDVRLVHSQ